MFEKSSQKLASLTLFSVLFIGVVNTTAAYTIMGNVDSYEKDGYNIGARLWSRPNERRVQAANLPLRE